MPLAKRSVRRRDQRLECLRALVGQAILEQLDVRGNQRRLLQNCASSADWPTVQAIWAQRLVPGLTDHLVARMAWDGQMFDGPRDPGSAINLYEPVPGHQAARGEKEKKGSSITAARLGREMPPGLWGAAAAA